MVLIEKCITLFFFTKSRAASLFMQDTPKWRVGAYVNVVLSLTLHVDGLFVS